MLSTKRLTPTICTAIALCAGVVPALAQDTTLTLVHSTAAKPALEVLLPRFEAENPGIKVNASYVNEVQSIRTMFTTGNAPDVSLVYPGNGSAMAIKQLAPLGVLADLSGQPAVAAAAEGIFQDAVSYDGKLYGLPTTFSYITMFVNQDVMSEIGAEIPKDFNELMAFCADAKDKTIPFAMGLKEQIPTLFIGYALAASTAFADNPDFAADQTAGKASFEAYRQSFELYKQMYDGGCFSPTATGDSLDDALRQVSSGKAAIFVGVVEYSARIQGYGPDADIVQAPFPGNPDAGKVRLPVGPGSGFGASAQSKAPEATMTLMTFLADNMRDYAASLNAIAATDAANPETPGKSEAIRVPLREGRTVLYLDRTWPNPKVQPVYMAGIQQLFTGQTTIDDLIQQLDDAYALQ